MVTLLMSALGASLVLTTSLETLIAANFRNAQQALYAADAALELALDGLASAPDWDPVLDGSAGSPLADGPPGGVRTLADGSPLDLGQVVNMTNCRKVTLCSASNLRDVTAERPWGANNPVWRLFAYGPLSSLLPARQIDSAYYIVVMVADDPSENDNDPLHDGRTEDNLGTGVLALRAEAFGPRGTHQAIEMTLERSGGVQAGFQVLSWRLLR
jgi:hypothetical protein